MYKFSLKILYSLVKPMFTQKCHLPIIHSVKLTTFIMIHGLKKTYITVLSIYHR